MVKLGVGADAGEEGVNELGECDGAADDGEEVRDEVCE